MRLEAFTWIKICNPSMVPRQVLNSLPPSHGAVLNSLPPIHEAVLNSLPPIREPVLHSLPPRAPPAACSLRLILGCRRSGSPRSRLASALGLRRLRILAQMSKCTGQLQTEQCHYTHPARKTKKTLYMGPLHLRACGRSVAPPKDRLAPQRALIRGARSNETGRRRPMTSMLWSGRQCPLGSGRPSMLYDARLGKGRLCFG